VITLVWDHVEHAFTGELEQHAAAYVDADWVQGAGNAGVPALASSEEDATGALLAVAESAASAAVSARRPAVAGHGLVARRVRELLGIDAESPPPNPDLIVETRWDPASLLESTTRVADLGTVVLAGPPAGSFRFDLYADLHVRGLRLVSAPSRSALHTTGHVPTLERPATVRLGEKLPEGAAWYRVVSS